MKCFRCTDLTERDAHREPQLIMQADQSVYLHPARATLPRPVLTIGEHDLPEVVEVDHTTDARPRKLGPVRGVGVPGSVDRAAGRPHRERPRSRSPGLTIHLLTDGGYRESAASHAFPGSTAVQIHPALNEDPFSAETSRCWNG